MHNEDIWHSQPSEKASPEIFTSDKEAQGVKISTSVERNDLSINKSATFRVLETATRKVANYMSNSDLRDVQNASN